MKYQENKRKTEVKEGLGVN